MARSFFAQVREFVEKHKATLLINYDGKIWEIIVMWDDEKIYVKNIGYYDAMELTYKKTRVIK